MVQQPKRYNYCSIQPGKKRKIWDIKWIQATTLLPPKKNWGVLLANDNQNPWFKSVIPVNRFDTSKSELKVHGSELLAELSTTLRVMRFQKGSSATPATGLISHESGLQRKIMAMKLDETTESW